MEDRYSNNSPETVALSLSGLDKKRFDIYTRLLEQAIIKLPKKERDQIVSQFSESTKKSESKLPIPLIYERLPAHSTVTPIRERSR